jgi:hypothetical protein
VVLLSFTRFATRISVGVRPKYLGDNLRENGETISLRIEDLTVRAQISFGYRKKLDSQWLENRLMRLSS